MVRSQPKPRRKGGEQLPHINSAKELSMTFFRYPGSKAKLCPALLEHLTNLISIDTIDEFREPFLGGGAIAVAFAAIYPSKSYWLNDLDPGITSLFASTIYDPEKLKHLIVNFEPSVPIFTEYKQTGRAATIMPGTPEQIIDLGFRKLALHQMSYSGFGTMAGGPLGGQAQQSAYKINSRWSSDRLTKKVDEIHGTFAHIATRITNLDFEPVIADTSCGAVLYLDPPYYKQGNNLYQCGFTRGDHERLSRVLQETSHEWVLSYDDCPEVRHLYRWATVNTVSVSYSAGGARRDQELIIRR
jgi:DNA adenine methylase